MRGRFIIFVFALALTPVFVSTETTAGLKVCNKSNRNASIAWALGTTIMHHRDIFIWGWAHVAPGSCEVLNGGPGKSIWYVYARSDQHGHWEGEASQSFQDDQGTVWNPVMNLCEPASQSPSTDDLQKGCNRLPYNLIDKFDGTHNVTNLLQ